MLQAEWIQTMLLYRLAVGGTGSYRRGLSFVTSSISLGCDFCRGLKTAETQETLLRKEEGVRNCLPVFRLLALRRFPPCCVGDVRQSDLSRVSIYPTKLAASHEKGH
jgi:hypothetical protein